MIMNRFFYVILLIINITNISCKKNSPADTDTGSVFNIPGNKEYLLSKDEDTILKNPCMGWGLYDDAAGEVANADNYWKAQDSAARKYASFFYIRWRWSDMEPEEGKYAWLYNDNYKKLIKGATDRGLKLAFRIYVNGQDNLRQATPDFVRTSGANGFYTTGSHINWTPYVDDTIFQKKFTNFIKAFAKEYDNPDVVDFIDGSGLGWWGEDHHIEIKDITKQKSDDVLKWITSVYGDNFKHVILVTNLNSQFTYDSEMKIAVEGQGYCLRRDGLGSMWFSTAEQDMATSLYPRVMLIGESCYWGGNQFTGSGGWVSDTKYNFTSWRQVYELTFQQAAQFHFNTLDLRTPVETLGWLSTAPDLVKKFIQLGGYRFFPSVISAPESAQAGSTIEIGHQWENLGTGIFPNNNRKWNNKYRIAFSFINSDGATEKTFIEDQVDLTQIMHNIPAQYRTKISLAGIPSGKYTLAVAIVNTQKNNSPEIKMPTLTKKVNGWDTLGSIEIK